MIGYDIAAYRKQQSNGKISIKHTPNSRHTPRLHGEVWELIMTYGCVERIHMVCSFRDPGNTFIRLCNQINWQKVSLDRYIHDVKFSQDSADNYSVR